MSMFDAVELGHQVSRSQYKKRERVLHTELLEVQRQLRSSNSTLLIIVSGVEGSGKGHVVTQLNTWLDNRNIVTNAYWEETDEERQRPRLWRFWRDLPARGSIGIMFGSWYTRPIIDHVFGQLQDGEFEEDLRQISALEHNLTDDGVILLKLWYHLPAQIQAKRLAEDKEHLDVVSPYLEEHSKRGADFAKSSELAIRATDKSYSPWHIIEASDAHYRDLTTGEILLETLKSRLQQEESWQAHAKAGAFVNEAKLPDANRSVLDLVDLSARIDGKKYKEQLEKYQRQAQQLVWKARQAGITSVLVFEGWDASGKGGAIRRLTHPIDARLYRVNSVAAPTDEEQARHYLWRFWRKIPRDGYMSIFDRSWYGRVLVERVEEFASHKEWFRAYQEINAFEEQLTEHGSLVLKFWLHIDKEEQLRRFKERENIPWKLHKITEEDWRNRERWDDYNQAVTEMVERTHSEEAPWHLIPATDKKYARVEVLRLFCDALRTKLES
jgi:polyphosphate:AMP phosphotransferase